MRKYLFIFFLIFTIKSVAQDKGIKSSPIDTLKLKLSRAKNDSMTIDAYYLFSKMKGVSTSAIDSVFEKISQFTLTTNCKNKALSLYRMGQITEKRSSDEDAVHHFLNALKTAEDCNYSWVLGRTYYQLGKINDKLDNPKVTIEYYHKARYYEDKGQPNQTIGEIYHTFALIYKDLGKTDSSLFYGNKCLENYIQLKDKKWIGKSYNVIGLTYKRAGEFKKSIEYLEKALAIAKELNNKRDWAGVCINISNSYKRLHQFDEAIKYGKEGTYLAYEIKEGDYFRNGLSALAEIHTRKKDYKQAVYYYKRHLDVSDSVKAKTIDNSLQELQQKYESDKKDHELKAKENSLKLADTKNSIKNLLITFSLVALLLAVIAVIFIFRSYSQSKKNAIELSQKNYLIAEKNKEITDSINYAKNIQNSLLSSKELFSKHVKEHFILLRPKDIVSGDFYWAKQTNTGFFIMCADCTGHGVPGAFMSLLGISYLNEITNNPQFEKPDIILNELRKRFIDNFSLNNNKDGMDASLIKLSGKHLEMAAANNPIWIIRNKQCIVIKPNKFPIGKHHGEIQEFSLNGFQLIENDLILMFTDGFADQFGGPKNKKYKYKKLEQFIIDKSDVPFNELQPMLENELKEWKGKNEQIDDVLVIGIRV